MISKLVWPLPTGSNRGVPNVFFLGQQAYHILTLSDMFCVTRKNRKHKIHRSVLWSHRHIRLKYLSNHISLDSGPFLSLFLSRKKKNWQVNLPTFGKKHSNFKQIGSQSHLPKTKIPGDFWVVIWIPISYGNISYIYLMNLMVLGTHQGWTFSDGAGVVSVVNSKTLRIYNRRWFNPGEACSWIDLVTGRMAMSCRAGSWNARSKSYGEIRWLSWWAVWGECGCLLGRWAWNSGGNQWKVALERYESIWF